MTGAVSAYNRLAYNLYLIAHNGRDIANEAVGAPKEQRQFPGRVLQDTSGGLVDQGRI